MRLPKTHRWRGTLSLALLLVASCGSTGDSEERRAAERRKQRNDEIKSIEEIPADYAELWLSFTQDRRDYPGRREAALEEPRQAQFLVDNLVRTLMRGLQSGAAAAEYQDPDSPFLRAKAELVTIGEASAPTLAELLALGNGQGPALAAELLIEIGRPAVVPLTALLEREDQVNARRRSAAMLARLPHAHQSEPAVREALLRRLADDEDWQVREQSAEALGRRGSRDVTIDQARQGLLGALQDEDSAVRRAALQGLVWLDDPSAVPALINHMERSVREGDLPGLRQAQQALGEITGHRERLDAAGWRAWWRDHRQAPRDGSRG